MSGERPENPESAKNPESPKSPSLPPPWFIRFFWAFHRAMYRVTGGRLGLWKPKPGKWGTMRLTTVGRKTGKERVAILGYFEDGPGPNLVTMAMNGWMAAEPAWWLNLQANPVTRVETKEGTRKVRGRAAVGDERDRLWAAWAEIDDNLEGYARRRPGETAVVILEPVIE